MGVLTSAHKECNRYGSWLTGADAALVNILALGFVINPGRDHLVIQRSTAFDLDGG